MRFLTSTAELQMGNGLKQINQIPNNFHILSYLNDDFLLSEVTSIEEVITEDSNIVIIEELGVTFSSNYPIVVKDENNQLMLSAIEPDDENIVPFDMLKHKIFDGQNWVNIEKFSLDTYSGYGYVVTVKDDYFFLNSLLISSK